MYPPPEGRSPGEVGDEEFPTEGDSDLPEDTAGGGGGGGGIAGACGRNAGRRLNAGRRPPEQGVNRSAVAAVPPLREQS